MRAGVFLTGCDKLDRLTMLVGYLGRLMKVCD